MRNIVIERINALLNEDPELETEISMIYGKISSLSNIQLLDLYVSLICEDE